MGLRCLTEAVHQQLLSKSQLTLERTLQLPEVKKKVESLPPNASPIADWIDGFDGSGSQSEAQQKSRNDFTQSHHESVYVCLRNLSTEQGEVIYDNLNKVGQWIRYKRISTTKFAPRIKKAAKKQKKQTVYYPCKPCRA